MTTAWLAADLARLADSAPPAAPMIVPEQLVCFTPGLDLWDFWPIQEIDGRTARFGNAELWISLGAPADGTSVERHGRARMRLLEREGAAWRDRGNLLPDGFTPGSREWSGSAIVDTDHRRVTLFFTAAGRRGERRLSYEQRLFQTDARVDARDLVDWSTPVQSIASDGRVYHAAAQAEGEPGTIKAFRDPAFFRDPADGTDYLLFAASLGQSTDMFNGAIGLAQGAGTGKWHLREPLVSADGVNNELERPHLLACGGLYYLFWSTQHSVFAPGTVAPTGLYGMVAAELCGPYSPLNGSGLVFGNPAHAPEQAYSWLVAPDLSVSSFTDKAALGTFARGQSRARHMLAPTIRLALDGASARVVAGDVACRTPRA